MTVGLKSSAVVVHNESELHFMGRVVALWRIAGELHAKVVWRCSHKHHTPSEARDCGKIRMATANPAKKEVAA